MPDTFYPYYNFPSYLEHDWQKLYDVATSYERAIKILLEEERVHLYLGGGIKSERDIFPILNLLHHYIELILKSIILKNDGSIPKIHQLTGLMDEMKKYKSKLIFDKEAESFIRFLDAENPNNQAFKYNFDRKGKEYFKLNKSGVEKGISLSWVYSSFMNIETTVNPFFKKCLLK